MAMRNKFILRSKISEAKLCQLVRLFCIDLNATQVAPVAGLNRNTVNKVTPGNTRTAVAYEAESPFSSKVEVDESYFGARRVIGELTGDEETDEQKGSGGTDSPGAEV